MELQRQFKVWESQHWWLSQNSLFKDVQKLFALYQSNSIQSSSACSSLLKLGAIGLSSVLLHEKNSSHIACSIKQRIQRTLVHLH